MEAFSSSRLCDFPLFTLWLLPSDEVMGSGGMAGPLVCPLHTRWDSGNGVVLQTIHTRLLLNRLRETSIPNTHTQLCIEKTIYGLLTPCFDSIIFTCIHPTHFDGLARSWELNNLFLSIPLASSSIITLYEPTASAKLSCSQSIPSACPSLPALPLPGHLICLYLYILSESYPLLKAVLTSLLNCLHGLGTVTFSVPQFQCRKMWITMWWLSELIFLKHLEHCLRRSEFCESPCLILTHWVSQDICMVSGPFSPLNTQVLSGI